jgi:hypothetical protein
MNMNVNAERLKVGDEVGAISNSLGRSMVAKVTKVTATQVTLDNGRRYLKRTGNETGGLSGGWLAAVEYTRRLVENEALKIERLKLQRQLEGVSWNTVKLDTMREIVSTLQAAGVWKL